MQGRDVFLTDPFKPGELVRIKPANWRDHLDSAVGFVVQDNGVDPDRYKERFPLVLWSDGELTTICEDQLETVR